MKVLRHLTDVHTVICGDFLRFGINQALFLRCESVGEAASDSSADILSIIDAETQSAAGNDIGFGRRFLLSDFSQVNIDRWNTTAVLSVLPLLFILLFIFAINLTRSIPCPRVVEI